VSPSGRFLSEVAVIWSEIASNLFGFVDSIGQNIKIKGYTFKVIDVLESSSSMMGSTDESIPITVAERLFLDQKGNHIH